MQNIDAAKRGGDRRPDENMGAHAAFRSGSAHAVQRIPTRRDFIKSGVGLGAGASLASAAGARAELHESEPAPMNVDHPIIDIHAHVSNPSHVAWIPDWISMDYESMKRHQRIAGIGRSFISDSSLYPKPYFEADLLERCKSDSSLKMWATYISWAGLYPGTGDDPIAMLERMLKDDRVVGVKVDLISGVWSKVSLEMVNRDLGAESTVTFDIVRDGDPLFELCGTAGKPLMCHADLTAVAHRGDRIVEMANRHPNVNVIIAHIGLGLNYSHFSPQTHFDRLFVAREAAYRNVYVDTSTYSMGYCGHIEDMAEKLGSDRMLFGSDSPAKNAAAMVARVRDAEMSPEHKERIFHGTARELFLL